MDKQITLIREQLETELRQCSSLESLENIHTAYLGRKGPVNDLFSSMKDLSDEDRRLAGQNINALKEFVTSAIARRKEALIHESEDTKWIDPTLPGIKHPQGHLHLTTQTIHHVRDIFSRIGFIQMSYPEVEYEYFSFDSLNMPKIHPARDDFETFFVDEPAHEKYGRMLLTPHTSSGQVREMWRSEKPPIKMINISRTYRRNWDATHVPMFHQFEGLCIDKGINISHLKGTIEYFAKEFFGRDKIIRLRPYDFLFTEPSFEVDIYTNNENIGRAGWLELGGAGMVHPNVLKEGGIDPNEYTGWAFGFGIERVAMMKGNINLEDMRVMYSGKTSFLKQF